MCTENSFLSALTKWTKTNQHVFQQRVYQVRENYTQRRLKGLVWYTIELSCYCTQCFAGFPGQCTRQLYPKLRQEHSLMPVQMSRHPRPPENPTAAPPAAEFNLRVEFDLENSNSDHKMVSNFPWIDWVYEWHVKNKFEIADPWHGIAFRITGPLWGESMGHWWILEDWTSCSINSPVDGDLWCLWDVTVTKS